MRGTKIHHVASIYIKNIQLILVKLARHESVKLNKIISNKHNCNFKENKIKIQIQILVFLTR